MWYDGWGWSGGVMWYDVSRYGVRRMIVASDSGGEEEEQDRKEEK